MRAAEPATRYIDKSGGLGDGPGRSQLSAASLSILAQQQQGKGVAFKKGSIGGGSGDEEDPGKVGAASPRE